MEEKITLNDPGYYLLTLYPCREQTLFQSVFDYQYAIDILASSCHGDLLGYLMAPDRIFCLAECPSGWSLLLDELQVAFNHHYEQCWRQCRNVISEQTSAVYVEESLLSSVLLELHHYPVNQGWVVDAALYPWSSDRYYRQDIAPKWLNDDLILQQLSRSWNHRHIKYQAAMLENNRKVVDLFGGNHTNIHAISSSDHLKLSTPVEDTIPTTDAQLQTQYLQMACRLISQHFEIDCSHDIDGFKRRKRRQFLPLIAWLLDKTTMAQDQISSLLAEDEDTIRCWLRTTKLHHPSSLLNKLNSAWQQLTEGASGLEQNNIPNTIATHSKDPKESPKEISKKSNPQRVVQLADIKIVE